MTSKLSGIVDRSKTVARDKIQDSVRTLYFPEIWYAIENYFSLALKLKSRRVLEIGYGVGLVGEAFAKSGWDVTCVDPSIPALADLKTRFENAGLTGAFEQAEPDALPFPNASFDYVVCVNALEFTPNPNGAVREIARVLTPGGKAVVATFNALSPWGLPAVARSVRIDEEKRTARFLSKDDFARLFKNNKLGVTDIKNRARYLPGTTRVARLGLPITGAFVALVTKPALGSP